MMNITKIILGSTGIAIALGCAVAMASEGFSLSKVSAFDQIANSCVSGRTCSSLLKLGVNPELYRIDEHYRNKIEDLNKQIIGEDAVKTKLMAQFSLRYTFTRNMDVELRVYETLHRISI